MGPFITGVYVAESLDGLGFLIAKVFFRQHGVIRGVFEKIIEDEDLVV